jgi:hypothetical protein
MAYKRVIGMMVALAAVAAVGAPRSATASTADSPIAEPLEAQPHMKAALAELETARNQLEKASSDKGGHRAKALGHVKTAIAEAKAGIAYDNAHPGAEIGDSSEPLDAQPHMKSALSTLEAAKKQLASAEHDKGGHRAKALKETELAIGEVQAGIRFDNQH